MDRGRDRCIKVAAGLVLGMVFQAVAPIGCAGVIQQNLEVLLRFDAVAGSAEVWQSLIWKLMNG